MAKTLKQILEESTKVASKAAEVAGLPKFKSGYPDTSETIQPQVQNNITGQSQIEKISPVKEVLSSTVKEPKDILIQKMTDYFNQPATKPLSEQYKELSETRGLPKLQENIGTFDEEVNKTLDLLSNLSKNIKERTGGFMVSEPQRARIEASERQPLTEQLGTLERGRTAEEAKLERGQSDILTQLGFAEEERKQPLEELGTLSELYKSLSPEEKSMAEKYGTGVIGEYNFYKEQEEGAGRTPLSFDAYQTMDANRKAKITAAANANGLDWTTTNFIDKQASRFDSSPIVKQFNEVQNKFISVRDIIDSGVGGPGDLALVFEFMKALDPTSVVRESEYEAAAKSGNIFRGWAAQYNGYLKSKGGFLPQEVKQSFLDIVGIKFNAIKDQYTNLKNETSRRISLNTGIENPEQFLTDYDYTNDESESALTELNGDVLQASSLGNYGTREELIKKLQSLYPEFDYAQIANSVYSLIPDKK